MRFLHAVENHAPWCWAGATTENPFFEVNSALISRSRVVGLKGLSDGDVAQLVDRAVADPAGWTACIKLDPAARSAIVLLAGSDGRASLTTPRACGGHAAARHAREPAVITKAQVESAMRRTAHCRMTRTRDMHYDIISAFIKSMRGSDPDAALYWLARMIDGERTPNISRAAMLIHASEDVGNAPILRHCWWPRPRSNQRRSSGIPNARINLAQAATYIALAPKKQRVRGGYRCCLGGSAETGPSAMSPTIFAAAPPRLRALRRVQIPARLSCRLG